MQSQCILTVCSAHPYCIIKVAWMCPHCVRTVFRCILIERSLHNHYILNSCSMYHDCTVVVISVSTYGMIAASSGKLFPTIVAPYTWFFNAWLFGRPEIADFWGLGGPGGPKHHSKRWGAKPPTLWNGFWRRRGRQNPKN